MVFNHCDDSKKTEENKLEDYEGREKLCLMVEVLALIMCLQLRIYEF